MKHAPALPPISPFAAAVGPASELTLRRALGGRPKVGCAIDGLLPDELSAEERSLLVRHFEVLTPENCLKPASVQPVEGQFRFVRPDALVAFAASHGLDVVGHCLVWHQQCPAWFFLDGDKPASRERVLQRMRTHIQAVAGRYRGRIRAWDVVNEAVADRGEFLRETPWLERVGEDFIEIAFRYAAEADPDAELYYNDFNIELPPKRDRTLRLLERLRRSGVRLDGVGIQGHWMLDRVPFRELEEAILAYHALGLKVMITELDIDVVERPDCGADVSVHRAYTVADDAYRDGCPPEVTTRQAEQYARLFDLCRRHGDKVARVSFWGLHDGRSWLNHWPGKRTNHPLLFDRQCRPKAAFEQLLR
jgi:endo-1,4-beta-xylanase